MNVSDSSQKNNFQKRKIFLSFEKCSQGPPPRLAGQKKRKYEGFFFKTRCKEPENNMPFKKINDLPLEGEPTFFSFELYIDEHQCIFLIA